MKKALSRPAGIFMTSVMLLGAFLPAGCANSKKDTGEIEELTKDFIAAVGSGDNNAARDLVKGDFSLDYPDMEYMDILGKDYDDIMIAIASKTEFVSFESIESSRKDHTASAKVNISRIDVKEFCSKYSGEALTVNEFVDAVDSYTGRKSYNIKMDYVFDESLGCWLVKDDSAIEYLESFDPSHSDHNHPYFLNIAFISTDEADCMFKDIYYGFAEGKFEQPVYSLDMNDMRIFEMHFYNGEEIYKATEEFTKAYFKYIVDHGISVESKPSNDVNLYQVKLKGTAPSLNAMFDRAASNENIIELYKSLLRYTYLEDRSDSDEYWTKVYAQFYYDLAQHISELPGEEFETVLAVDRSEPDLGKISMELPICFSRERVTDKMKIPYNRNNDCFNKAVNEMKDELPEEWYDYLDYYADRGMYVSMDALFGTTSKMSWAGSDKYENQAGTVTERIPSDVTGYMIYGDSEEDENGMSVHYSKEPGWLCTAGYCVQDDDIIVLLKYDRKFKQGTVFEFDWYVNGEMYGDTTTVVLTNDGADTFDFTVPDSILKSGSSCEIRMWEEGHKHVIAYVKLSQT